MSAVMNDRVKKAIEDLTSLSFAAKVIADRIQESISVAKEDGKDILIASLQKQLAEISSVLEMLRSEVNQPEDAVFTDIQADNFTTGLYATLKELKPVIIMSVYTRSYLSPYPRNIRVLICTTLLNYFSEHSLVPLRIWYEVVANNGSL